MSHDIRVPARVRWARLRFAIIGPLLSAPPEEGALVSHIAELAARAWKHPTTQDVVRFSAKSIERWYYLARDQQDSIEVLARKVPKHAGTYPSLREPVVEEIRLLRKQHPRWSYQLIYDNLVVLARQRPALGRVPGYATVRRYMKQNGLCKQPRPRRFRDGPRVEVPPGGGAPGWRCGGGAGGGARGF
jgi:putative transposase